MNMGETKICPLCAGTIKAAAKVCSFCQTHQSLFGRVKSDLREVGLGLLFAALCIPPAVWLFSKYSPERARAFTPHRKELVVVGTSLEYGRQTPDSWLASLGTNQLDRKWSIQEMEVRFHDPEGRPLDVRSPSLGGEVYVEPCLWLKGFVTNTGKYPWRIQEIEVRFLDGKSNLIDVQNLMDYQGAFVVEPHRERAFRLPLSNSTFTNTDTVRQVRVQRAGEP